MKSLRMKVLTVGLKSMLGICLIGFSPVLAMATGSFNLVFPPYQESSVLQAKQINPLKESEEVQDAEKLLKAGEVNGAIKKWQSIASDSTELAGYAHKRLGDIYITSLKDYPSASNEYSMVADGTVPAPPLIVGNAKLRLAYIQLHNSNYQNAIKEFLYLAQGHQAVSYSDAYDASIRAAHIYQRIGDYDNSAQLFSEIAQQSIPVKDASYAQLQLCGVLWEQGKTKTTFAAKTVCFVASQKACQDLLKRFSAADEETKGTAELLYLEDEYFMKNYQTTIKLSNQWMTKYPELRRQYLTTLTWLGMADYYAQQYDDCIKVCEQINSGKWTEKDPYSNFNVFGYAYLYEALAYEKQGNTDKAEKLRKTCLDKDPSWYQSSINQVK